MKKLLTIGFILLGLYAAGLFLVSYTPVMSWQKSQQLTNYTIWSQLQAWRLNAGYPAYRESHRTCDIAQFRLKQIQKKFDHHGLKIKDFCSNGEICKIAENIARGQSDARTLLDDWLGSPPHAANLKQSFTEGCVATNGYYTVLILASFQ